MSIFPVSETIQSQQPKNTDLGHWLEIMKSRDLDPGVQGPASALSGRPGPVRQGGPGLGFQDAHVKNKRRGICEGVRRLCDLLWWGCCSFLADGNEVHR